MPTSPDLSAYHELTFFDRTPADLLDRALLDALVKFPGWTPREGNTEVVLLEGLALVVAELVYAINRLPSAVAEVLIRLFGVTQLPGAPATVTLRFTLADNLGHEVPIGTRVRLDLGAGVDPLDFTTDTGVIVAAGAFTGDVAATATRNTDDANGVAAGTAVTLVDPVGFVQSVATVTAPVADGADPETSTAWRDRAINRFSRLTDTLALPEHFTAEALDDARVLRAQTKDNWNAGVAANGHVTVGVLGQAGALLSAPVKAEIEANLEAKALALLDVHVVDPTITAQAVTATVRRRAGYDSAAVQAAVVAALNAYLDPATWEWSATIRRFELVSLIDQVEGVDYVELVAVPAADVALAGDFPLADAGALTITVNAP